MGKRKTDKIEYMAEPSPEVRAEIDRRLAMPYTYQLFQQDGDWFASVAEFPICMSEAKTPSDAVLMVREAAEGWLQCKIEDGYEIPDPIEGDEYSGRFLLRVPTTMHRDLARRATREGVSLNTLVVTELARVLGPRD